MQPQLREKKKDLPKKIKWEGPIATFFKCGHRLTPKNAATAQKNVASEWFFGPVFKTHLFIYI